MTHGKTYLISVFTLAAVLTAFPAECGTQKQDPVQSDTCFLYTDGLLDDLCAIEYLAGHYDHAVIMLQDPEGLADSPYGSGTVTDENSFFDAVSQWFTSVIPYSDISELSEADLYLLAPLTEFAGLLINKQKHKERCCP